MLPPHFPRQGLQRLMNFGALSRGFSTCCLRFKNRVATTPARLASGWLARLYREGVEPSGSLQKVSDHISRPPFLDLSWRKGSFTMYPPTIVSEKTRISPPVFRCQSVRAISGGRIDSFGSRPTRQHTVARLEEVCGWRRDTSDQAQGFPTHASSPRAALRPQ